MNRVNIYLRLLQRNKQLSVWMLTLSVTYDHHRPMRWRFVVVRWFSFVFFLSAVLHWPITVPHYSIRHTLIPSQGQRVLKLLECVINPLVLQRYTNSHLWQSFLSHITKHEVSGVEDSVQLWGEWYCSLVSLGVLMEFSALCHLSLNLIWRNESVTDVKCTVENDILIIIPLYNQERT